MTLNPPQLTSGRRPNSKDPTGRRRSVLVLGSDDRSFLASIRSFGRAGFDVDTAWCDSANSPALQSRFIRDRLTLARYRADDGGWLVDLNDLVDAKDYDFILPCHDAQVLPLQSHRHLLRRPERYALVPQRGFDLASDKSKLHELSLSLGVPVPEQIEVQTRAELEAAARVLGYPFYAKPLRSTDQLRPLIRREVQRFDTSEQLSTLTDVELAGTYLAQRCVAGRGMGVNILAMDGEILTALQHERLHEPPAGGGSSYRRSVPLDPLLLSYSQRLIAALEYTGPAMVEFKVMADRPYLMEINARLWGSIALTTAAGIDIPLFWYQMLVEGRRNFPQTYRSGLHCRHWRGERYWLRSNIQALRSAAPNLIRVPPMQIVRELANIPLGRETSDTFCLDDPAPGLRDISQMSREVLAPRIAKTAIARLAHRTRLKRRIAEARSMLFVCYGNICRSPFAEAVARERLDVDATSAGVHPRTGRLSPEDAIQAASDAGYDLRGHRSVGLTKEMLRTADIIFVFDQQNRADVLELDPSVGHKIAFLGAFGSSMEITDPYERGIGVFRDRYREITSSLEAIAKFHRIKKA